MDHIDQAKATRVWQRVHTEPTDTPRQDGFGELIAREWEAATAFLQLSRRFQSRQNALLRQLSQQEHAHVACLKGIYTLLTGKRPDFAGVKPETGDPQTALRKYYGQQMRTLALYEQRASDPEFGHIFSRLSQQEQAHCQILLELLGNL